MSRYLGSVCKLCRREQSKLFLKGDKCYTKCVLEKRPSTPGMAKPQRGKPSAYAIRLLRNALSYKSSRLQPYVWRLLASGVKHLSRNDPLLAQANEVKRQNFMVNHVLDREISRFIDVFNSTFNIPKI